MAITITGEAGANFDLTVTDTATATGTKVVTFETPTAIKSVTYTNSSKVATFDGAVGTSGTTIDLYSLNDATDSTYYLYLQDNTSPIVLSSCSIIIIYNKSANVLTVQPGASNSFLTASEQVTIPAGAAIMYCYGTTAKTVDATHRNIKIVADVVDSDCQIFILGA